MTVEMLIEGRARDIGDGLTVRRILPFRNRRMVGPFVFFDHMGPLDVPAGAPERMDVLPHPHIGLATVTYLFSGAITHRDSLGFTQEIRPGEVNWMVAGRGITHSERLEQLRKTGGTLHGIQAWVALPETEEECEPSFAHHEDLPEWAEDGVRVRLIAGEAGGRKAAPRVLSPLFYQHLQMEKGARHRLDDTHPERAVYCVTGEVAVGDTLLVAGQMAVLTEGAPVTLVAREAAVLMALGGAPLGKRYLLWNFVSSSEARLQQAADDWRHGRMALPVGDDKEYVPLPERGG